MEYKDTTDNLMKEIEFVGDIKSLLTSVSYDLGLRNDYINTRDRAIYDDGLFEGLDFPDGHDKTMYNWAARVVDIHSNQVMGRGFNVYSSYDKEDPDTTEDPKEKKLIELRNKRRKADADARKKLVDAMKKDNGGNSTFQLGAKIGSGYGFTLIKEWFDKGQMKTVIKVLESVQNYYAGWDGDDFRTRDWDAFVYQISLDKAQRDYGNQLKPGESFEFSAFGNPLGNSGTNNTSDPIDQNVSGSTMPVQTDRPMITVIDITGNLSEWAPNGKNKGYKKVEAKDTKPLSCMIVGGKVVQVISEEALMPDYYIVPNKIEPRRAWGASDLNQASLDINRTFIEVMSTDITLYHKDIAPTYAAKGFIAGGIPPRRKKEVTMIPMNQDQSIELIPARGRFDTAGETPAILETLKEEFVRSTSIGRVMFDDPTVNADSNQALMTTLKGLIDVTEEKQARWEIVLSNMFQKALLKAAKYVKEIKAVVETDETWDLYIEWPSVLRKEDASYQQMWLNIWNAHMISPESYLQKLGFEDPGEELDRIRDSLTDPVLAAMMGNAIPLLANQLIAPPQPQQPQVRYNVNVAAKGDPETDPAMNDAIVTEVLGAGQYPNAIAPSEQAPANPAQAANPTLTPDQNTGQTASQPGSGAPAVSPEGAIAQVNQNQGA